MRPAVTGRKSERRKSDRIMSAPLKCRLQIGNAANVERMQIPSGIEKVSIRLLIKALPISACFQAVTKLEITGIWTSVVGFNRNSLRDFNETFRIIRIGMTVNRLIRVKRRCVEKAETRKCLFITQSPPLS
jgi:hypothetical protein